MDASHHFVELSAAIPRAVAFGPFHDDYTVYDSSSILAWLAAAAWLLVAVLAFILRQRTRLPLFALLWFTVAHLVESTVIPLELYFEHRNYLAVVGPLFALVVAFELGERSNASGRPAWRWLSLIFRGVCNHTLSSSLANHILIRATSRCCTDVV